MPGKDRKTWSCDETGTGRVRINGVDWKAVSENETVIPEGSIVVVREVAGAKLIVSLSKETAGSL